jgi:hypothetical protein
MITGEHFVLRSADPDDARALLPLYDYSYPRSGLLDSRMELYRPTLDEFRLVLTQQDIKFGMTYTLENSVGQIRGLGTFRGFDYDAGYSEFYIMLHDTDDYDSPLALEVYAYMRDRSFGRSRLNKIVTRCLDNETAYRDFVLSQGFESSGVQRDVFASRDGWSNQETFTLFAPHDEEPTNG